MEIHGPSIEYLELFEVTVGVIKWIHRFANQQVALFCDNRSVVDMINGTASKCKNCMVLLRIVVLQGLIHNVKITAKHVSGNLNYFSDALSRLKIQKFHDLAIQYDKTFEDSPAEMPPQIWPMDKVWLK